jgi:hypothetical protein
MCALPQVRLLHRFAAIIFKFRRAIKFILFSYRYGEINKALKKKLGNHLSIVLEYSLNLNKGDK